MFCRTSSPCSSELSFTWINSLAVSPPDLPSGGSQTIVLSTWPRATIFWPNVISRTMTFHFWTALLYSGQFPLSRSHLCKNVMWVSHQETRRQRCYMLCCLSVNWAIAVWQPYWGDCSLVMRCVACLRADFWTKAPSAVCTSCNCG